MHPQKRRRAVAGRSDENKIREAGLFGADGQDVFALDLDFHADGRANVAALDDGATNPEIAGKIGGS